MQEYWRATLTCAAAAIILTACGPVIKQVDFISGSTVPEDAHPAPIEFRGIEVILPPGATIGYERTTPLQTCGYSEYPLGRDVFDRAIDKTFIENSFRESLQASGYDVVGSLDLAFDEDDEKMRAEYAIKGKIRDAMLDMCSTDTSGFSAILSFPYSDKSQLYLAIDWSVYDMLRRATVFKVRTEGYASRALPPQEGLAVLFGDAFTMAAHNLASDPDFYNLIVKGTKPPSEKTIFAKRDEKWENRPRVFDPQEEVVIRNLPLSHQPFAKDLRDKASITVMPQKNGHGAGFFISKDGHILTNAHVVGDAQRMRIVTTSKKFKTVAEVLRVDKARDVALLKLEEIPEGLDIQALPIRDAWPKVGEDIYAVGTPQDYRQMQDTVTKGIVSAHRYQMKFLGTRQNFIQGDVEVHPGNSGGPLVDENGNIVGMTVGGYTDINDNGMGLNYFIPISEALDRLGVQLQAP
ncbi:MAG: trypsin-like peptidase domain-containing protein [Alphaproteobacteria bacterium]|nr:trypsin-like peptidase domain-containing protein [Alphaproteobacteria bacterium]